MNFQGRHGVWIPRTEASWRTPNIRRRRRLGISERECYFTAKNAEERIVRPFTENAPFATDLARLYLLIPVVSLNRIFMAYVALPTRNKFGGNYLHVSNSIAYNVGGKI